MAVLCDHVDGMYLYRPRWHLLRAFLLKVKRPGYKHRMM